MPHLRSLSRLTVLFRPVVPRRQLCLHMNRCLPVVSQPALFRYYQSTSSEPHGSKEDEKEQQPILDESSKADELKELKQLLEKEQSSSKSLQQERDEFKDKYQRALAEAENNRVRMRKEVDKMRLFGIQGFCKDLLEISDILGRATESVPPEQLTDTNSALKGLYDGLCMTQTQLDRVFNKHGLVKIEPKVGSPFDPEIHESLFQQEVEGMDENCIAIVSKIGFRLHDRTLRPAIVGISKAKSGS